MPRFASDINTIFPSGLSLSYTGPQSFSVLADVAILGFQRTGNLSELHLTLGPAVSPVPLPPALPLFVAGLGILAVFGFATRKKVGPSAAACVAS